MRLCPARGQYRDSSCPASGDSLCYSVMLTRVATGNTPSSSFDFALGAPAREHSCPSIVSKVGDCSRGDANGEKREAGRVERQLSDHKATREMEPRPHALANAGPLVGRNRG
eukprot:2658006-Rhodomonas_salina.3